MVKNISEVLGDSISEQDALERIKESHKAYGMYLRFPEKIQKEILEFIQGSRGLPILYDSFFKHIMDPVLHPHRLEQFLSAILGQKICIKAILPKEGIKLSDNGSFVIMDVVVELEDGAIVDLEIQKLGYRFPGARTSCYSSDLVMRQYNRMKAERKEKFAFKDMKPVYLIILMEKSPNEFQMVSPAYLHRGKYTFDSGVEVDLLTHIIYVSLDTFHSVVQNITNHRDAWLTFLSSDKPEDILKLVQSYPEFKECYQDIYQFRKMPEELMSMHTDAFLEAERNEVLYNFELQQKENEAQKREIEANRELLKREKKIIEEQRTAIEEQRTEIEEQRTEIEEQRTAIEEQRTEIEEQRTEIESLRKRIEELSQAVKNV